MAKLCQNVESAQKAIYNHSNHIKMCFSNTPNGASISHRSQSIHIAIDSTQFRRGGGGIWTFTYWLDYICY